MEMFPQNPKPVRYLRFWATLNGNMQSAMNLVFDGTLKTKETIQGHPLDPKQGIDVFASESRRQL
jgi:hypothetical protein